MGRKGEGSGKRKEEVEGKEMDHAMVEESWGGGQPNYTTTTRQFRKYCGEKRGLRFLEGFSLLPPSGIFYVLLFGLSLYL